MLIKLNEHPTTPSIVANNTNAVWDAMNAHNKTYLIGEENMDMLVFEFRNQAERNRAIEVLNKVQGAWPDDYKPEPR